MRITLPWPDRRLSPNHHCHWRVKADAARTAKMQGLSAAREVFTPGADTPLTGELRVTYQFYPPDKRHRDDDNVVASLKNYRDGVAQGLLVDDKQFRMQAMEWCDVIKGGQVIMLVEEI